MRYSYAQPMIKHPDHVTLCVSDLPAAKAFVELLGFNEEHAVVIEGEPFSTYMQIPEVKADHVTMVLPGKPRFEIQLLHFHRPVPEQDPLVHRLDKLGYNHLCLSVDDIEAEVERLKHAGVKVLSDIMDFNSRRLVYFAGPDGIVLELAEWQEARQ